MKAQLLHTWNILRNARFGLCLLYFLGFALAQSDHASHHHDHPRPEALLLCLDPGQHWAPHPDSHHLDQAAHSCPVCAYRQGAQLAPQAVNRCDFAVVVAHLSLPRLGHAFSAPDSPFSQRGPPRA